MFSKAAKWRMIDWFCRDGGASMGFYRAALKIFNPAEIEIVGVDKEPRRDYPFKFVRADALELMDNPPGWVLDADANGGGPPCQKYTNAQRIRGYDHPDHIPATRAAFQRFGKPWVIENVEGAPLIDPVMLCGAMFPGLSVYRHRLFETSFPIQAPPHPAHAAPLRKMGRPPRPGDFMHVVGNFSGVARAREAMGIDWMTRDGLREAIPPAYTQFIGEQLLAHIRAGV